MKISKLTFLSLMVTTLLQMSCIQLSYAQDVKQEYEKNIKVNEVPEQVLELLSPILKESRRIRYYEEYDRAHTGHEIEMQWRGKQLSIEFYEDGRLMDIEELITFENIEEEARKTIADYLQNEFSKYKISRLQRQHLAEENDEEEEVIEEFMEGDTEDLTIRYEMVAQVKGKDMFGAYEFLFDHEGQLINTQKIERRSSDNVLY